MSFRKIIDKLFQLIMFSAVIVVFGSLIAISLTIIIKGLPTLNWQMISDTPHGGYYLGKAGGIFNAIAGSFSWD